MWMLGTLAVGSGGKTIDFTARPTLLALGGTVFTNNASLSFQAAPSCAARKLDASANTSISVVPLTHENERHRKLYWMEHGKEESAEILARIQATDQRYDGRDGTVPDGALSSAEVKKAFAISLWTILFHHDSPPRPGQELLALYFNLATRRLNADTPVRPEDTRGLGFTNVRDAGIYGNATMLMPFNSSAKKRYEDSRGVIDEIND